VGEAGVFDIRSDHNMLVIEFELHEIYVSETDQKSKWQMRGSDWAKLTDTQ
jgi:hypothetical protein